MVREMLPGVAAIGIRFDVDKVEADEYGFECWKMFWRAIVPTDIAGGVLFEGDTLASLAARENVFCIAVQHADARAIDAVRDAVARDPSCRRLCSEPMFVEGSDCTSEPLIVAGEVDGTGAPVGVASHASPALQAVRGES